MFYQVQHPIIKCWAKTILLHRNDMFSLFSSNFVLVGNKLNTFGIALRTYAPLGYKSRDIPKLTWFWKKPPKTLVHHRSTNNKLGKCGQGNLSLSLLNCSILDDFCLVVKPHARLWIGPNGKLFEVLGARKMFVQCLFVEREDHCDECHCFTHTPCCPSMPMFSGFPTLCKINVDVNKKVKIKDVATPPLQWNQGSNFSDVELVKLCKTWLNINQNSTKNVGLQYLIFSRNLNDEGVVIHPQWSLKSKCLIVQHVVSKFSKSIYKCL